MTKRANGDGSIYRRKDGRWVAAALGPADGRRHVRYIRAGLTDKQGQRKAEAKLRELRAELQAGLSPEPGLTTQGWLDEWLEDAKTRVRPGTWVGYQLHVRHLAPLGRTPLGRLAPSDIRRVLRGLLEADMAPVTVGKVLSTLRSALRQAVADGLIARNPALSVKPPAAIRVERAVWTPEQVAQFLVATRTRHPDASVKERHWGALWAFLIGTGMRLGEACAVRWSDIEGGVVMIESAYRPLPAWARGDGPRMARVPPKTPAGRRTVVLPAFVVERLAEHPHTPSAADLVFCTRRGTPLEPGRVLDAFKRDVRRAKLPEARIHDLRHVAATLALGEGMGLEDVKRLLGHATIALTSDHYAHLVAGRQRQVAAALDRAVAVTVAVNKASEA